MSINLYSHVFDKKQLWYLVTVCGFAIGSAIGWRLILFYQPQVYGFSWIELFFWVVPAGGAGLGMGVAQWILIRHIHKNTWLWILATFIGMVVTVGSAFLIFIALVYYSLETPLSWILSNVPSWFLGLAIIAPIAIFTGPFLQWMIWRYVISVRSFKEFLRMSVGWILSIIILFTLLGLTGNVQIRNYLLNSLALAVCTIPSGLIVAYSTREIVGNPINKRHSYD